VTFAEAYFTIDPALLFSDVTVNARPIVRGRKAQLDHSINRCRSADSLFVRRIASDDLEIETSLIAQDSPRRALEGTDQRIIRAAR
jgi:hypothetical protein